MSVQQQNAVATGIIKNRSNKNVSVLMFLFIAANILLTIRPYNLILLSLRAFPITETELNAIAALATMGLKRIPKNG